MKSAQDRKANLKSRIVALPHEQRDWLARHLKAGDEAAQDTALPAGDHRLTAFVVPLPGAALKAEDLRDFLRQRLPDHMVPAFFRVVDELPLLANGKPDRQALAQIRQPESEPIRADYRTPTEEILTRIWTSLLQRRAIGIHDEFFSLGGHSLLAIQACSRTRDVFSIELSVRDVFEFATIARLAQHIDSLRRRSDLKLCPPVVAVDRSGPLPLSFAQKRLWFLDQLEGHSANYNVALELDFSGLLDILSLEQSLTELLRRHESLRTVFRIQGGNPVQVITPAETVKLEVIDVQRSSAAMEGTESAIAMDAIRLPFDLQNGPLFRARLLRVEARRHKLILCMHHIASDGWSVGIVVRELADLYRGFSAQVPPRLPDLPVQYGDFSVWQNRYLTSDTLAGQLEYWRRQLHELPAVVTFRPDRARPPVPAFRGGTIRFRIDEQLSEELRAMAGEHGASLFMILLAVLNVLLARYGGQQDIVTGTAVANRTRSEIEPLIGFFANTLVLRTGLHGNPDFVEVLRRVRKVTLDAYAHADLPFEQLVDDLNPERHLSHAPLFQIMFVLQSAPERRIELADMTISVRDLANDTAKFDLVLSMEESSSGLSGEFEYNAELFDAATIRRLSNHFCTLVEAVVRNPGERTGDIRLVTPVQCRRMWTSGDGLPATANSVHGLWERQAERTPDAIAVLAADNLLSYDVLNRRANQLAHYLLQHGAGPGNLVGLCVERSVTMAIAILGILKSGAAYVPLDPAYPPERLAFMAADAGISALLTSGKIRDSLPKISVPVFRLDTEWAGLTQSQANPRVYQHPEALAYVIYTSGSTGRPKGVEMSHGALVNLLGWHSATLGGGRRTLQFASLGFDVAFQELFSAWCSGGCIVLLDDDIRKDPPALMEAIADTFADTLFLPPVVLRQLAEVALESGNTPKHLRNIITAGEQLRLTAAIVKLFENLDRCRLHNHYGPTETHVVTSATLNGPPGYWPTLPPIGRPVSNTRVYVLDGRLQPVPAGIPGEIYIGGRAPARGYRGSPALTADRFRPDPFAEAAGARMYRTGDQAQYLPDDNIMFLGRSDLQVKIRGFRVELGEIESVLNRHPHVYAAVVAAKEGRTGEKVLVAYVVPKQGATVDGIELLHFLRVSLPSYMLPAAFEPLDAIPLTATGKVDRLALPEPRRASAAAGYIGPRDSLELRVAQVWSDLLDSSCLDVRRSFFDLGGNSLLAVLLIARINREFGKKLPVATLFQSPTVEALAARIRAETNLNSWSPLVPVRSTGSGIPLFLVHPGGGHVLCYAALAHHLGLEQPVFGLQAFGIEDGQTCIPTVEAMASQYVRAIRETRPQGPYRLAGWSMGGIVAFEMAQQLSQQGEEADLLALLDSSVPGPEECNNNKPLQPAQELLPYYRDGLSGPDEAGYFERLSRVFQANVGAMQCYVPRPYAGRVIVFRADGGDAPPAPDSCLGWEQYVHGRLDVRPIPGDHYSLLREPCVLSLAQDLRRCLETNDCLEPRLAGSDLQRTETIHASI